MLLSVDFLNTSLFQNYVISLLDYSINLHQWLPKSGPRTIFVPQDKKSHQMCQKISILSKCLLKKSTILLQISFSWSVGLFNKILWSTHTLFNVLWSASSKSLGNTDLHNNITMNITDWGIELRIYKKFSLFRLEY